MKPYTDTILDGIKVRKFDVSLEDTEFIWHRDLNDRVIKVIEGNDWKLQYEDELPIDMFIDDEFYIPKMVYHRIIKGSTDLTISIKEKI